MTRPVVVKGETGLEREPYASGGDT